MPTYTSHLHEDVLNSRVVPSLNEFAKALATYNKALFYYDGPVERSDKEDQHSVKNSSEETTESVEDADGDANQIIDKTLIYKLHLDAAPQRDKQASLAEYTSELSRYASWLSLRTATAYLKAITALSIRHNKISQVHENELQMLEGCDIPDIHRDFSVSAVTAQRHIDGHTELLKSLIEKLELTQFKKPAPKYDNKEDKHEDWCGYSVEFQVFQDACALLMNEITLLCARADELQKYRHQKTNKRLAIVAIVVALVAFGVTLFGTFFSRNDEKLITDITSQLEARHSILLQNISALTQNTETLVTAINKYTGEKTELSNNVLIIKNSIEGLIKEPNSPINRITSKINDIDQKLEEIAKALPKLAPQPQPNPPSRETPKENKEYAALMKEIALLRITLAELKIAIEARPPTVIDNSTRKHGVLNWW